MQDRIPLYPGRVKMTPVAGQANTFDLVRADDPTQAGTPLNKATLLKDATAALYGLGTGAVPDDVFAELGKYKQYWWKRRTPASERYVVKETAVNTTISFTNDSSPQIIKIAQSYTLDANTGGISLDSPVDYTVLDAYSAADNQIRATDIVSKAPCYIMGLYRDPTAIFYLPEGSNAVQSGSAQFVDATIWVTQSAPYNVYLTYTASTFPKAQVISSEKVKVPASDWQYIQSSNRNAYPDSGTQDGYEYEYLGVPFDNAVTAPKIEVGSYVGTGTYGQANPNTLTFGFVPKLVWIYEANTRYISTSAGYNGLWFASWPYLSYLLDSGTTVTRYASLSGETLSWYESSSAFNQLNDSEKVYTYIAIG